MNDMDDEDVDYVDESVDGQMDKRNSRIMMNAGNRQPSMMHPIEEDE